jgi:hypothetical protein
LTTTTVRLRTSIGVQVSVHHSVTMGRDFCYPNTRTREAPFPYLRRKALNGCARCSALGLAEIGCMRLEICDHQRPTTRFPRDPDRFEGVVGNSSISALISSKMRTQPRTFLCPASMTTCSLWFFLSEITRLISAIMQALKHTPYWLSSRIPFGTYPPRYSVAYTAARRFARDRRGAA